MPTQDAIHLAQAALEQIKLHPETHKQADWRCKTGMCFAGWYGELDPAARWLLPATEMDNDNAMLFQHLIVIPRVDALHAAALERIDRTESVPELIELWNCDITLEEFDPATEAVVAIGDYTRCKLELDFGQAHDVFAASNTLEDIEDGLNAYVFNRQA